MIVRRVVPALAALVVASLCLSLPAAGEATIRFLDPEAGAAALADGDDPYVSLLQRREMEAKAGVPLNGDPGLRRNEFRSLYRDAVLEFTDAEKDLLRAGVGGVQPYLEEHYPVLARTPWSFIKVTTTVESGLPHTRGGHIVVSKPFLTWLTSMPADEAAPGLANLLLHELMHVAQRDHADAFAALYADVWGMRRVTAISGDEWLVENQVINPDGTDRWLFPSAVEDGADFIWPTLLLQEPEEGLPNLMQHMQMIAVAVDETDGGFVVRTDDDGTPEYGMLTENEEYTGAFSYTRNLYHPNEITADAIARLVVAEVYGTDPPEGEGFDELAAWFGERFGPQ